MASLRKPKESLFDESRTDPSRIVRSLSLDNLHITTSKPGKAHHSGVTLSPSGLSLKGLKKKFGIKISKSNQDGLEVIPPPDPRKSQLLVMSPEVAASPNTGSRSSLKKKDDKQKSITRDTRQRRKISEGALVVAQQTSSSNDPLLSRLGIPELSSHRPRSMTDTSDQFILVDASSMDESLDGTGSAYDTGDDVDGYTAADSEKSKHEIEKLKRKIGKTRDDLIDLQTLRDESVKEYLQSAEHESGNPKTKVNFEKRNQKTNQSIQYLQRRLEKYQRILKEEDVGNVHGPRGVLRGMQDAVKAGASSISGKVTRPLGSFNHFMKKDRKGGSTDNISTVSQMTHPGSEIYASHSSDYGEKPSMNFPSDEDNSSSDSVNQLYPPSSPLGVQFPERDSEKEVVRLRNRVEELLPVIEQAKIIGGAVHKLEDRVEFLSRSLQDERYNAERLQCQLNDLTELHQNEIHGLQMELGRAEERMECVDYRSAERAGEIEEAVDSCVTRINKMELQQQQQQQLLLSVDTYFDGSGNAKLLLSKALSLVISVFTIFLLLFSTFARVITPFCSTRLRLFTTVSILAVLAVGWRHSNNPVISALSHRLTDTVDPILSRIFLWRQTNDATSSS